MKSDSCQYARSGLSGHHEARLASLPRAMHLTATTMAAPPVAVPMLRLKDFEILLSN